MAGCTILLPVYDPKEKTCSKLIMTICETETYRVAILGIAERWNASSHSPASNAMRLIGYCLR